MVHKLWNSLLSTTKAIEGLGEIRASGISLKSELFQKCSIFHIQFCLGVLNNVLYVFWLTFASFVRY